MTRAVYAGRLLQVRDKVGPALLTDASPHDCFIRFSSSIPSSSEAKT